MERSDVFEGVQIGVETLAAPGTIVAANRRLLCMMAEATPDTPSRLFRPSGSKAASDVLMQKEHTKLAINGIGNFYDIIYPYSSLLCAPTQAAIAGAAGALRSTFKPQTFAPDQRRTFTIEKGSAAGASRLAHARMNSMSHTFGEAGLDFTGEMLALPVDDTATLTPNPTNVKKLVVQPKKIRIEVGDALNNMVKLTRCISTGLDITDLLALFMALDDGQDSFSDVGEKAPGLSANILVARNSVAAGLMNDLRTAKQKFARFTVFGPDIVAGTPHRIEYTFPFKFTANTRGATNDFTTGTFNMEPIYEDTFNGWLQVVVDNAGGADITALAYDSGTNTNVEDMLPGSAQQNPI